MSDAATTTTTKTNYSFSLIASKLLGAVKAPIQSGLADTNTSAALALAVPVSASVSAPGTGTGRFEECIKNSAKFQYKERENIVRIQFKDRVKDLKTDNDDIIVANLNGDMYRRTIKPEIVKALLSTFSLGDFMTRDDLPSDSFLESIIPEFFFPERNVTADFLKALYRNSLFYTRTKPYDYKDGKKGVQISVSKYGVRDSGVFFMTFDEDNRVKFWNLNEDKTFINVNARGSLFQIVSESIDYIYEHGYIKKIGFSADSITDETLSILKLLVFTRVIFNIGEKNGPFLRAHYQYINTEEKKQEWKVASSSKK